MNYQEFKKDQKYLRRRFDVVERLYVSFSSVVPTTVQFMLELEGLRRYWRKKIYLPIDRREAPPEFVCNPEDLSEEWTREEDIIFRTLRFHVKLMEARGECDPDFTMLVAEPPLRQRDDCVATTADTQTDPINQADAEEMHRNVFRHLFEKFPRVKKRLEDFVFQEEDSTT